MTAGSNILAEIPAYAAGMTELNKTGLPSEGVRRAEEVSESLTYNPRTMEGQAGLQSLTNGVMKVMDALGVDEAVNYLNNTVVPRIQETFGEDAAREIGSSVMMAIPFVRKVPGIKAFHGSPHDFPPVDMIVNKETGKTYYVETDRFGSYKNHPVLQNSPDNYEFIEHFPQGHFDNSKMGTGEGAQAYGHGLYFAEAEPTAKGYRDRLVADIDVSSATKMLPDKYKGSNDNARRMLTEIDNALGTKDIKSPSEFIDVFDVGEDLEPAYKEVARLMENKGRMYEVDIDASPDELLYFDAPLSQQSQLVQKVLKEEVPSDVYKGVTEADGTAIRVGGDNDYSGAAALQLMGNRDISPKDVSERLRSKGIKGIRYKDGFSRNKDGGSYNYVIFDDRLISIAKKYGIAIPAAAALLSQETGLNPSSFYEEDNPV